MQICKKIKLVTGLVLAGTFGLWAQQLDMPAMPSMPSVTMPSMPTMGSTYYKPQMPEYYTGKQNTTTTTGTSETQSSSTGSTSTSTTSTAAATNALTSSSTLSSLTSSTLSALDVSSLYNSGMFDTISSLLGTGTTSSADNTSTNILLQEILVTLNELKAQNGTQAVQNTQTQGSNTSDFNKRQPSILRFKVNGNSIVDSFKTVFFSESEADGTFLLTADRVYYVNQRAQKETVYLLFKTKRNNGSTTIYSVIPTLMQDSPNQNSFLYRMCEQIDMEAQKTGNLVAVHLSKDQFSVDILLDLDN